MATIPQWSNTVLKRCWQYFQKVLLPLMIPSKIDITANSNNMCIIFPSVKMIRPSSQPTSKIPAIRYKSVLILLILMIVGVKITKKNGFNIEMITLIYEYLRFHYSLFFSYSFSLATTLCCSSICFLCSTYPLLSLNRFSRAARADALP